MLILSTKLKNKFLSVYDVQLKNIIINGDKRGCSGFISYNNNIVYINTEIESSCGLLYRIAKHNKDYTGGVNQWAKNIDELVINVTKLLNV
jgi:hypothetical protein